MKSRIRDHPIAAYPAIMYPVAWLLNVTALLGTVRLGIIPANIPYEPGAPASALIGLGAMAFLVTSIADGKPGVCQLPRRFYALRVGPQWYALALCLAPGLVPMVALLTRGRLGYRPAQPAVATQPIPAAAVGAQS